MLGAVITTEECFLPVRTGMAQIGHHAAPDDVFLGLRGMRTLSVRLERHQKNAMEAISMRRKLRRKRNQSVPIGTSPVSKTSIAL